jgi:hypothetical protein
MIGRDSNKNIVIQVYPYSVFRIRIRKFLGIKDRDPLVRCTDPDPPIVKPKIVRNPLISAVLRFLYDFLSVKNDVNVPSKSTIINKNIEKLYFVCILKVTNEKIRGRICYLELRIPGSGSVPKCDGSGTL